MKLRSIVSALIMFMLVGCATRYPVTIAHGSDIYTGTLTFDGPYTGVLSIPNGPEGESFVGRYVATDTTSVVLAVGASGEVEARGIWTGRGSRGSSMTAEVKVGRGGHGIGTAKQADGKEYQISF